MKRRSERRSGKQEGSSDSYGKCQDSPILLEVIIRNISGFVFLFLFLFLFIIILFIAFFLFSFFSFSLFLFFSFSLFLFFPVSGRSSEFSRLTDRLRMADSSIPAVFEDKRVAP